MSGSTRAQRVATLRALCAAHRARVTGRPLTVRDHSHGRDYGVRIDPLTLTVHIDPDFDAHAAETLERATALCARLDYLAADLADMGYGQGVIDAVTALRGAPITDAVTARTWLDEQRGMHYAALAGVMPAHDPERVPVVALACYALGTLDRHVDLLTDLPVLIDPATEPRGRMREALRQYPHRPHEVSEQIGRDLAAMRGPDRALVRAHGRRIAEARDPEHAVAEAETGLWADHVDRDRLNRGVRYWAMYNDELTETVQALDGVSDPNSVFTATELSQQAHILDVVDSEHDQVLAELVKDGVHPLEYDAIHATMRDIAAGHLTEAALPRLLLLDERSKAATDAIYQSFDAEFHRDLTTQNIEFAYWKHTGDRPKIGGPLAHAIGEVTEYMRGTAARTGDPDPVEAARERAAVMDLGEQLTAANLPAPVRAEIADALAQGWEKAEQLQSQTRTRVHEWEARRLAYAQTPVPGSDQDLQNRAVTAGIGPSRTHARSTPHEPRGLRASLRKSVSHRRPGVER